VVGSAALLYSRNSPLELWNHLGERWLLVIACKGGELELYAVSTSAAGLGRDEATFGFLGLRYEQSGYEVGRSFEVTVPL